MGLSSTTRVRAQRSPNLCGGSVIMTATIAGSPKTWKSIRSVRCLLTACVKVGLPPLSCSTRSPTSVLPRLHPKRLSRMPKYPKYIVSVGIRRMHPPQPQLPVSSASNHGCRYQRPKIRLPMKAESIAAPTARRKINRLGFSELIKIFHAAQRCVASPVLRRHTKLYGDCRERVGRPGGSTMDVKITPSSGNVFTDLGFGEDEAEHLIESFGNARKERVRRPRLPEAHRSLAGLPADRRGASPARGGRH